MTVQSAQLDNFAVKREAMVGEGGLAEADAPCVLIDYVAGAEQLHVDGVEMRAIELPELDTFQPSERDSVPRRIGRGLGTGVGRSAGGGIGRGIGVPGKGYCNSLSFLSQDALAVA